MKRISRLYLALVLVPVVAVVVLAGWMRDARLHRLAEDEATRMARAALALVSWEDLEAGSEAPALARRILPALEGRAGYEAAVYRNGRRVAGTDNDFGPPSLPPEVTAGDGGRPGEGTAFRTLELEGRRGVLAVEVEDPGPARDSELAVLAAPTRLRLPPPLPEHRWPVILGTALGLLLASWGVLSRPDALRRWLVVALPVLALWWVVGRTAVRMGADGESALGRELALASVLIPEAPGRSTAELARMTGFQVSLVEDGALAATSLPPDRSLRASLEGLPLPPPGRNASGVLEVGSRRDRYLAARGPGRDLTVMTAPAPAGVPLWPTVLLGLLAGFATCTALLFPFRATRDPHARTTPTS